MKTTVSKHASGVHVAVEKLFSNDSTVLTKEAARATAWDIRRQARSSNFITVDVAVTDERVFRWSGDQRQASQFANDLIKQAGVAPPPQGER